MTQGELFALAAGNIDFLRRSVRVEMQIKRVGGRHVFAPIKNKKPRDVPVDEGVIPARGREQAVAGRVGQGRDPRPRPDERDARAQAHGRVGVAIRRVGLAEVAAYLGDTQAVVLSTYSHFMPAQDNRARDAMRAFFAPAKASCAPDVPRAAR